MRRRSSDCRRRCPGAWDCSTTTATAGSTCMRFRAVRSRPPNTPACGDRLFRNRGDGTFEDVTERAGLHRFAGGYGHGVAVGDYDNDGHPDLFVTRWRSYPLLRNRGDGSFDDVTAAAGLGGDRDWPTSAAWADLDADGDLDLYVCHYLVFDSEAKTACADPSSGKIQYCNPRDFVSLPDHVFRNDGGRFVDITKAGGFVIQTGAGWAWSRPTSTTTIVSTFMSPMTCPPITCSATWAVFVSKRSRSPRARRSTRAATFSREWAWRAATWMATYAPTWPSPIITASRPRFSATWAVTCSRIARPPWAWPRPHATCWGLVSPSSMPITTAGST